jgi:hypothetical protein
MEHDLDQHLNPCHGVIAELTSLASRRRPPSWSWRSCMPSDWAPRQTVLAVCLHLRDCVCISRLPNGLPKSFAKCEGE